MKNFIVLFLLLIFSCTPPKKLREQALIPKGKIIATFTIIDEKPRYNAYGFEYKPKGKEIKAFSNYNSLIVKTNGLGLKLKFKPDFSIDNKQVFILLREHEVGTYEFFDYNLFINGGLMQSNLKSKSEFLIPFNVETNTINYIGDITFYPRGNENGNFFKISDKYDRDINKILEKFPGLFKENIINKSISNGELNNALIEIGL